jgi:mitochondrial fission protein ELM1
MTSDVCWVLTTGEAGMRSQALGLAEAVGLPIEEKRIVVRKPWTWLPGGLVPTPLSAVDASGDRLAPPWPRLIVGCGRRSIGVALTVKHLSGGRTIAAYVQNPEWARAKFDLVVAMPHDGVVGPNVVTVPTALHRVTPERLAEGRRDWRERLSHDGRPVLGVLIGGDNGNYRLSAAVTTRLIRILKKAHTEHGMSAAITPSRRTGGAAKRAIAEALAAEPFGMLWDGTGDNPYFGILALADRLIVTEESISMISEALATGRPVHVLPLEGSGMRHAAFLERMVKDGVVSPIDGDDLDWRFAGQAPLCSTDEPARRLRAILELGEG